MPLTRTGSSSSDYYDFYDDDFLEVLGRTVLPGDAVEEDEKQRTNSCGASGRKETSEDENSMDIDLDELTPPTPAQRPREPSREPSEIEDDDELQPPTPAQRQKPVSSQSSSDIDDLDTTEDKQPLGLEHFEKNEANLKRKRDEFHVGDSDRTDEQGENSDSLRVVPGVNDEKVDADIYGASRFGEFGEYMRRKRAKLQIQNQQFKRNDFAAHEGRETSKSTIFKSIAIYVNGWTNPSVQDLRKLIVEHGGVFQPYLDQKSIVTHIITASLTPAKLKEFQHMKVVRPEWLTDSVQAGTLLRWQDYRLSSSDRFQTIEGTKGAQKALSSTSVLSALFTSTPSVSRVNAVASSSIINMPPPPIPHYATLAGNGNMPISSAGFNLNDAPIEDLDLDVDPVKESYSYAAASSNPNAKRAMENPSWRSAHTSIAGEGFIEGFYKNSRLHHLSTWKAELQELVAEAQERAESNAGAWNIADDDIVAGDIAPIPSAACGVSMRGARLPTSPSKGKEKGKETTADPVFMHCDFDCFFVAAGLIDRPQLKGKPVVVCHSQGTQGGASSTSEIASCSYEARDFGVRNGMSLQQARKMCPQIQTIPYEFEKYKKLSLQFYTVLMVHAEDLQAVSVDEALVEVTSSVARLKVQVQAAGRSDFGDPPSKLHPAKQLAETIRSEVRKATGCEISIGISHNILLARIATKHAKPAGSYHLLPSEIPSIVSTMDISDIRGFGWATKQKALEKLGTSSLSELASKSKGILCEALGKTTGETLYKAIRGIDDTKLESNKPRKSVSCDITYGIRFENNAQVRDFVMKLAEEVSRRLKNVNMIGRSIALKVMKRDPTAPVEAPKFLGHGACDTFNKQGQLLGPGGQATADSKIIGEQAWKMLDSFRFDAKELRGLGIQIQKLEHTSTLSNSTTGTSFSGAGKNPLGQSKLVFKAPGRGTSAVSVQGPNTIHKYAKQSLLVSPPASAISTGASTSAIASASAVASTSSRLLPPAASPPKLAYNDLPSFSQVDKDIFNALPLEIQQEIQTEYKRRSTTPAMQPPRAADGDGGILYNDGVVRYPNRFRNFRGLARQFGARGRPVLPGYSVFRNPFSPKKSPLNRKRTIWAPGYFVNIENDALRELGMDPEVFWSLHPNIQREQISLARYMQKTGKTTTQIAGEMDQRRVVIRNPKRKPRYPKKPNPKAKYPVSPSLKQKGSVKGDPKLCFTKTEDLLRLLEMWVNGFRKSKPMEKDIQYFKDFLLKSIDGGNPKNDFEGTDEGMEKAVSMMRWWMISLRKIWWLEEDMEEIDVCHLNPEKENMMRVGVAWWSAFRKVKESMDDVIFRRFGGRLSLK